MNLIIDKDTQIYNINISNRCEYSYFDMYKKIWIISPFETIGIYITINNIVTTFIPFTINSGCSAYKWMFNKFYDGETVNYLNNDFPLEKNMFELLTINKILNIDMLNITNFYDLKKFYNKMELLGYIKVLYAYTSSPSMPSEKNNYNEEKNSIKTFYYTELFINKIINYYSIHNIIKFNNNINYDLDNICKKYDYQMTNERTFTLNLDLNHNINISFIESKNSKKSKSISFYRTIDEFIKQRSLDKKYKIHQLEPLLIEELPDDIANPINLLDLTVDEKPKNTETELIDL